MKFHMMVIELPVPSDMDPSDVLEAMHEVAAKFAEEHPETDDDGEEVELDEETKSWMDDLVSVTDKGEIASI